MKHRISVNLHCALSRTQNKLWFPVMRILARLCLISVVCVCTAGVVIAQTEPQSRTKPSMPQDLPDWNIRLFAEIVHKEHPGFARWFCALGDVNGDGFDDFAVSSAFDTTFVFFGGHPLDPEPVLILPGGRKGLASGDFNGDGLVDIGTAIQYDNAEVDPDKSGHIRLFFQRQVPPYFGPEPDMVLEGEPGSFRGGFDFGNEQRSAIQTLDFNGDGYPDFLLKTYDPSVPTKAKLSLLYGGPLLDNETDLEFTAIERGLSHHFAEDILTGDLNGDGRDDILVYGTYSVDQRGRRYWEYFPGNNHGWTHSTRTLHSDSGWAPLHPKSNIMDVNHDGCDDIIDGGEHKDYGDALLFLGSDPLPQRLMPNDSIPNIRPYFGGDNEPGIACPVGDMNGDGIRDLLIGWGVDFIRGTLYYLYPVTNWGLHKQPLGAFGTIPDEDWVESGAYDAGDVNGDGFDDVIVLGRGRGTMTRNDHRFQIYLGDPHMATAVQTMEVPDSPEITVYPNPAPITQGTIRVQLPTGASATASLSLYNAIGQRVKEVNAISLRSGHTITLPVVSLSPGIYHLTIHQHPHHFHRTVVLY